MMSDSVMCAFDEGNFVEAERLASEALEAAERAGDPFVLTASLGNAGLAALFLEHFDEAERFFREQLASCRRERLETRWAEPALGSAVIAAQAGLHERAAVLAAAAEASLREHASESDLVVFLRLISRYIDPVRSELGDHAWTAAVARGRALTQDEIYALTLDAGGS
jgi:hypothetical protein